MVIQKKSSAQRAREFWDKHEKNRIANLKAKEKWRLQMSVIRRKKVLSEFQRFGRVRRKLYPFTMAVPPFPGSRSTSDLDESIELHKRLNSLISDPEGR
jgi:hypothetical protein